MLTAGLVWGAISAAAAWAPPQEAASPPPLSEDDRTFFEQKIRPVLVERCYKCHSTEARKRQGGLHLDWRDGIRKGGDSGAAVVPGDVGESLIISALRYDSYEMPPDGQLPDHIVADFVKWIERGAPDPRDAPTDSTARRVIDLDAGREFWCFQPIARIPEPVVQTSDWPLNRIDRWVLNRLEHEGIEPVAIAHREALARRLYFDLLGLPPTPDEIDAFMNDERFDAWPRLVDRLLASPRFGEHWGRHWLDVARYAESTGGGRTLLMPDAWRYRDYVIRAFNGDKPYDRFIVEQLAGDLLPPADSLQPHPDRLVATAYLALGPTNYERQDKDILEMDVIDEQLDTLGKGLLAMTVGCARCHDHKFDPIPTRDYYALAGILKSTQTLIHDNVSKWVTTPLPVAPDLERRLTRHVERVAELNTEIAALKRLVGSPGQQPIPVASLPGIVLDDSQAQQVGSWMHSTSVKPYVGDGYRHDENTEKGAKTLTFVPPFPGDGEYEVRLAYTPGTNRATNVPVTILHTGGETTKVINQQQPPPIDGRFVSLGHYHFDTNGQWFVLVSNVDTDGHVIVDAVQFVSVDDVDKAPVETGKQAEPDRASEKQLKQLEAELKRIQKNGPKRPVTMSVRDAEAITDFFVCIRGTLDNRGPDVPRGFLSVVGDHPPIPGDASGRLELARWIASPTHPLTARVISNRVWYWLTGTGLVRTVDNFGEMGERPSHPELLDYLAAQLIDNDWSIKSLVREIVLSRTYQLSTADSAAGLRADPENRLHWRMNRRRLNAEAIRDAMLTSSGQIRLELVGENIKAGTTIEYGYKFDDTRRTIYTPIFRNTLLEILEVFDFADPNRVHGRRSISTTATQALYLMNHPFVMEQAEHAARRALRLGSADNDSDRIARAYRELFGRRPSKAEIALGLDYLKAESADQRLDRWTRYFHTLFSSLEFRYVN